MHGGEQQVDVEGGEKEQGERGMLTVQDGARKNRGKGRFLAFIAHVWILSRGMAARCRCSAFSNYYSF